MNYSMHDSIWIKTISKRSVSYGTPFQNHFKNQSQHIYKK